MFYYLAKILWFAVQPSMGLMLVLALGLVFLWTRWARAGRRIAAAAGAMLLVAGLSPLGQALTWPLEDRFPPADLDHGAPVVGIVVLGGAFDTHVGRARGVATLNEAGERMTETIVLARRFPNARVVFSGGGGATRLIYAGQSESVDAETLLIAMGLDRKRLLLEDRSRDTYENALYTHALVRPQAGERWLLITSALHMPRAMGCFRQVGFDPAPWPVDYRTRGPRDWLRFFDRPSEGWRRIDVVAREWIGLVVYWVAGRISSPFPAP